MSAYWRHLGERLVIFVATIAISVTIVFFVPRLVPGDPLGAVSLKLAQVGGNLGGKELIAEYTRRFGLDKSPAEQYVAYLPNSPTATWATPFRCSPAPSPIC